jgi:hypothetical protein
MRAAGITAFGEPVEIFEVDEVGPPAADEVLLDVAAAGIGSWGERGAHRGSRQPDPRADACEDGYTELKMFRGHRLHDRRSTRRWGRGEGWPDDPRSKEETEALVAIPVRVRSRCADAR